jgi:hypothetical protein
MSNLSGIKGAVKLGTVSGSAVEYPASQWSLDLGAETPDVSNFKGDGWKTFVAGLKSWSGSVSIHYDTTDCANLFDLFGTTGYGKFYLDDTGGSEIVIEGTIFINSLPVRNEVAGSPTMDLTFQGSGAPTLP